jgi:outer membrane protein assembly factor BamE (lipoprotein component of BamABCDE complex)
MKLPARSLRILLLLAVCPLLLGGCHRGTDLRKANVDQVMEGMAKKQVESILGMPTTIDTRDFVLTRKTTYVYTQGKDTVTVVFKEDKVQSKDSTLTD